MKYGDEPARAKHLGALLATVLDDLGRDALLCPVPLHPKRERERGYNQSLLVAKQAAGVLDIQVVPLLRRTRETAHQVGLDAAERWANVVGAFEVDRGMLAGRQGQRVVLVDDVMTTGATLQACALALQAAGVGRVDVATVARNL